MSETKLILTNRCNLNCSYCYEKNKSNGRMTKQVAQDIMASLIEKAEPGELIDVSFHGGEPLLEFDVIKHAVDYLKLNGSGKNLICRFSITTNGTLVNEEIAEYFAENDFRVKVSLDGKKETHNLHRRTRDDRDTYDDVIKAMHLFKDKNCNLSIRMTVTPETVDEFTENVRWLRSEGFKDISAIPDSFADWTGKFKDLEKAYMDIKDDYIKSLDNDRFYFSLFDGKITHFLQTKAQSFCNAGFGHYVINPDGSFYPCAYVIDKDEFRIGNIRLGVDKKKRCETFSKYVSKDYNKCDGCKITNFCQNRKCSFNNYISTGYLNVGSDFWCRHDKFLYKIIREIVIELCERKDKTMMQMLSVMKTNPAIIPNEAVLKYLQA